MLETNPYAFQQLKWALLSFWSGPFLTAMFWRTIFLQGT
jgi:Ni/Fe-hydrogenase subunit HybB-like protein